jgi:hypothetical protein
LLCNARRNISSRRTAELTRPWLSIIATSGSEGSQLTEDDQERLIAFHKVVFDV